jgi:NIMA (never in mitosis gene a)-related kinase
MDLKEKDKKNALNEIRILASIEHPNIIQYREAFFDNHSEHLCIVMELAPFGDLSKLIQERFKKA